MNLSGSKFLTSHPNRTSRLDGSKRRMGAAPERPASSPSQVSATVFPSGETSPNPVTTTRRFKALLPHLVVEVLERVADGPELLGLFVRDVDVELLLEGHHELHGVEAVSTKVLHEAGVVGQFLAFDAQLLDDDVLDLFLQVAHDVLWDRSGE